MQSGTSCFNKTIFKKNITHFWPIWGIYLVFLLYALGVIVAHFTATPYFFVASAESTVT